MGRVGWTKRLRSWSPFASAIAVVWLGVGCSDGSSLLDPAAAPLTGDSLLGVEFEGGLFVCCGTASDELARGAYFDPDSGEWRVTGGLVLDVGPVVALRLAGDSVVVDGEFGAVVFQPHDDDEWRVTRADESAGPVDALARGHRDCWAR